MRWARWGGGDPEAVARRAQRVFGAPTPLQWLRTRGARSTPCDPPARRLLHPGSRRGRLSRLADAGRLPAGGPHGPDRGGGLHRKDEGPGLTGRAPVARVARVTYFSLVCGGGTRVSTYGRSGS